MKAAERASVVAASTAPDWMVVGVAVASPDAMGRDAGKARPAKYDWRVMSGQPASTSGSGGRWRLGGGQGGSCECNGMHRVVLIPEHAAVRSSLHAANDAVVSTATPVAWS